MPLNDDHARPLNSANSYAIHTHQTRVSLFWQTEMFLSACCLSPRTFKLCQSFLYLVIKCSPELLFKLKYFT